MVLFGYTVEGFHTFIYALLLGLGALEPAQAALEDFEG